MMLIENPTVETKRNKSSVIKYKFNDVSKRTDNVDKRTFVIRGVANKSLKIFSTSNEKNSIWDKRLDIDIDKLNRKQNKYNEDWQQQQHLIENIFHTINQITHKDDLISAKIIRDDTGKITLEPNKRVLHEKPVLTKTQLKINNLFSNNKTERERTCKFTLDDECKFYPCSNLTSYTSILGPKNDYRSKTAPSKIRDTVKTPSVSFASKAKSVTPSLEDQLNFTKERGKISEDELNYFHDKISFKRPMRQAHSVNDLNSRIEGIESRVKYCKEKTYLQMAPSDRTVRYGAPLPSNFFQFLC